MAFRAVQIGTTVTKISAFTERRRSLVILNLGTGRIFISQDQSNLLTDGFPVDPGVTVSFSEVDGDDPRLAIFAQSVAGTQDVRVQEGFPL